MKCPSAGLLVVTWYLLAPPFQDGNLNLGAPLLQWDQSARFASLSDCIDDRNRQLQGASEESQHITSEYWKILNSTSETSISFRWWSSQLRARSAFPATTRAYKRRSMLLQRRMLIEFGTRRKPIKCRRNNEFSARF